MTPSAPSGTRKPIQPSPASPIQTLQSPGDEDDDAIPGLLSDASSSNASADDEREMPPLRGQARAAAAAGKAGSAFATGAAGLGGWVVLLSWCALGGGGVRLLSDECGGWEAGCTCAVFSHFRIPPAWLSPHTAAAPCCTHPVHSVSVCPCVCPARLFRQEGAHARSLTHSLWRRRCGGQRVACKAAGMPHLCGRPLSLPAFVPIPLRLSTTACQECLAMPRSAARASGLELLLCAQPMLNPSEPSRSRPPGGPRRAARHKRWCLPIRRSV